MISIVTGTLNRKNLLPNLIKNTVDSNDKLELVLVDGGSSDGTIEYLEGLNHSRIKLIKVGSRSPYPHFMNLGIENSTYEWVCQWNDDALLVNDWSEVISEITDEFDFYLFNWKYGTVEQMTNVSWLNGTDVSKSNGGWCLLDKSLEGGEIVVNYGLYNKKIFKDIGLYNNQYKYYYADGDMSIRSHCFGYKHKSLYDIKVCSVITPKTATHHHNDKKIYDENIRNYRSKKLSNTIKKLR